MKRPLLILILLLIPLSLQAAEPVDWASVQKVAQEVDRLVQQHWQAEKITPAEDCTDWVFLRRATLDLLGRVPTRGEIEAFQAADPNTRRETLLRELMSSPEYPMHLAVVLDDFIQGQYAGDQKFREFLTAKLEDGATWDELFDQFIRGPWEGEDEPANQFLLKRIRSIDELTNDTASAFFGVQIACAKCHDHPLVEDWYQKHYYGMASFFNRTYAVDRNKIAEKEDGIVKYTDVIGEAHEAKLMFLNNEVIDEPRRIRDPRLKERHEAAKKRKEAMPPSFSRREQLVEVALKDQRFFSRSIVNRMWAWLLGRGLVHPVDQMHSQNPASVPGVLELLAQDTIEHDYDLNRLMAILVRTKTYQLSSRWESEAESPAPEHFARALLREQTPEQFALSMVVASGDSRLDQAKDEEDLRKRRQQLEGQSRRYVSWLDERQDAYQTSTVEALYISNNNDVQQLVQPRGGNLVERLNQLPTPDDRAAEAIWTLFARPPEQEELGHLSIYLEQFEDPKQGTGPMVWALMTSAEFRFNY